MGWWWEICVFFFLPKTFLRVLSLLLTFTSFLCVTNEIEGMKRLRKRDVLNFDMFNNIRV